MKKKKESHIVDRRRKDLGMDQRSHLKLRICIYRNNGVRPFGMIKPL